MLFSLIKYFHILSAITAVGANITYGIWMSRASREPAALPFVLHSIKLIDDRVANPLYAFQLLTGLTMAFIIPIPLTTPWLEAALVLYAIATILGMAVFVPLFRHQIQVLERDGFASRKYKTVYKQNAVVGVTVGLIVIVIVFLMVVKPPLW